MSENSQAELQELLSACSDVYGEICLRTQKPGVGHPAISMITSSLAGMQAMEHILPDIISERTAIKYFTKKLEILKNCLEEFPPIKKIEIN